MHIKPSKIIKWECYFDNECFTEQYQSKCIIFMLICSHRKQVDASLWFTMLIIDFSDSFRENLDFNKK